MSETHFPHACGASVSMHSAYHDISLYRWQSSPRSRLAFATAWRLWRTRHSLRQGIAHGGSLMLDWRSGARNIKGRVIGHRYYDTFRVYSLGLPRVPIPVAMAAQATPRVSHRQPLPPQEQSSPPPVQRSAAAVPLPTPAASTVVGDLRRENVRLQRDLDSQRCAFPAIVPHSSA